MERGRDHLQRHSPEIKYQERFTSWVEGYRAKEEYIAAMRDLNKKVL